MMKVAAVSTDWLDDDGSGLTLAVGNIKIYKFLD